MMPVMAVLDNLIMGSAVEPFAEASVGESGEYQPAHPALAVTLEATNRTTIDDVGFAIGLNAVCRVISELLTPR